MDPFEALKSFIKDYKGKSFEERLEDEKIEQSSIKHIGQLKAATIDKKNRTVEFVATREIIDRHGDVVKVAGIGLENYIKNPVVLFAHDYSKMPVGKSVNIRIDGDSLITKVQFPTKEMYEFGDTVWNMVLDGFLNTVSIGFIPIEEAFNSEQGGFVINKSELLEISIVPVPANPAALVRSYKSIKKDIEEKPEEKQEELIDKDIFNHNVSILKTYRKFQVLVRSDLGIEPTEDEEETTEKVLNAAAAVIRMVKAKCQEENPIDDSDTQPKAEENPEQEEKSLIDTALKAIENF